MQQAASVSRLPDKVRVRRAGYEDAGKLYILLRDAYDADSLTEDGKLFLPKPDPRRGLEWVTGTLLRGAVWMAVAGPRCVGSVALSGYVFPWSPRHYGYMEWLYVRDDYRKGNTAGRLLDVAHAEADRLRLPLLSGSITAHKPAEKDRFFQRHDYRYVGGSYIREPHGRKEIDDDNPDEGDPRLP